MVIANYADLESEVKIISPQLIDWNPTDAEYQLVDAAEIAVLVDQFPQRPWREGVWECEEIARGFVSDVRGWEADSGNSPYNKAVGVAFCSKVNGTEMKHTLNILFTDQGPVLLDMQTKEFWQAKRGEDEIYFIEM